ncbi:MAG: hypothetical protein GXO14_01715 [Thermococci archaeon]|nr:hypothetical protein [Thermococci archaeon]
MKVKLKPKVAAALLITIMAVFASACISGHGHPKTKSWAVAIGDEPLTIGMTASQMPNGNYIVVGMTNATSSGGGSGNGLKTEDFLVMEMTPGGKVLWERTYGGKSWDYAIDVAVSKKGEIAIGGSSGSFGGAWLLLLNDRGDILGQFKYRGMSINALTFDGSYILAAGRYGMKAMLLKIAPNGSVVWSYLINNTGVTAPSSIALLPNGNLLVAGTTSGFGNGENDFWLAEFDSSGRLIWQKAYGGKGEDILYGMAVHDGRVYLAGTTNSFGVRGYSALLVETDVDGSVKLARVFVPPKEGWANSVAVSKSGDVLLGGISYSSNGSYAWLAALKDGNIRWQRFFGGTGMTWVKTVRSVDGGYIAVGSYEAPGAMTILKPPQSRSVLVMKLCDSPPSGQGFKNANFTTRSVAVQPKDGRTAGVEVPLHLTPEKTNATSEAVSLPVRHLWSSP